MEREEEIPKIADIKNILSDKNQLYNDFNPLVEMLGNSTYVSPESKQTATMEAWVARNDFEELMLFEKRPYKEKIEHGIETWATSDGFSPMCYLNYGDFPSVTWENSPKKVKVTIELEDEK